jgi:hypothetical protein
VQSLARGKGRRLALALALASCTPWGLGAQEAAPLKMQELQTLAAQTIRLERVGPVESGDSFNAYLVAHRHACLRSYALVAVPVAPPQARGYSVLVANLGIHPDPPRYGVPPEGRDWRPGNYYRPVPAAYAATGFLVVMPDYRGHNVSEGREFIASPQASAFYAEVVVAFLRAIGSLDQVDTGNVFMWGHSAGGPITITAALAAAKSRVTVRRSGQP